MTEAMNRSYRVPPGWHTVTPRIAAHDAKHLVEFLKEVFGATGEYQHDRPSEIRIGDSVIMIGDAEARGPKSAFLYVYVADTDTVFQRAVDAGARAIEEPFLTPYGDRRCMVEDQWGNSWQIATLMGGSAG